MTIPEYFQDIDKFDNPNGHPNQVDFDLEGLTTIDPASGNRIWNPAGRVVINEIISTRFELALAVYDHIKGLESQLPEPTNARQIISRGYYAMYNAGRAVSLAGYLVDHGAGLGGHGKLIKKLDQLTRGDPWYPSFHGLLASWKELRHCADYNLFTKIMYMGNPRHRHTTQFQYTSPGFPDLIHASLIACSTVEDYLKESQRFITSPPRSYHLGRTI